MRRIFGGDFSGSPPRAGARLPSPRVVPVRVALPRRVRRGPAYAGSPHSPCRRARAPRRSSDPRSRPRGNQAGAQAAWRASVQQHSAHYYTFSRLWQNPLYTHLDYQSTTDPSRQRPVDRAPHITHLTLHEHALSLLHASPIAVTTPPTRRHPRPRRRCRRLPRGFLRHRPPLLAGRVSRRLGGETWSGSGKSPRVCGRAKRGHS